MTMFRKKLSRIDISPRYLCTCCWSSKPRRDSDIPGLKDTEIPVIKDNKIPETPRSAGDGESVSQSG